MLIKIINSQLILIDWERDWASQLSTTFWKYQPNRLLHSKRNKRYQSKATSYSTRNILCNSSCPFLEKHTEMDKVQEVYLSIRVEDTLFTSVEPTHFTDKKLKPAVVKQFAKITQLVYGSATIRSLISRKQFSFLSIRLPYLYLFG